MNLLSKHSSQVSDSINLSSKMNKFLKINHYFLCLLTSLLLMFLFLVWASFLADVCERLFSLSDRYMTGDD